jgi:hypothetical protein
MPTIKIQCVDHVLSYSKTPVIASGATGENDVQFDFDSTWHGYAKIAVFYQQKGKIYYSLADKNNIAKIPNEVMKNSGTMYLGVMGVKDDMMRTSDVLCYRIKNGTLYGIEFYPKTAKDIYRQLVRAHGTEEAARKSADSSIQNNIAELIDIRLGADGVRYNTAGDAVREQIGKFSSEVSSNTDITKHFTLVNLNLIDAAAVKPGAFYDSNNGKWTLNSNYSNTDFIPVTPGASYYKSWDSQIVFWDENKEFLSGVYEMRGNFKVPDNANVKYATFNIPNTLDFDTLAITLGDTVPDRVSFIKEMKDIENDVDSLKGELPEGSGNKLKCLTHKRVNLFYKENATLGGYYTNTNGSFTPNDACYSTDFVPIEYGDLYVKNKDSQITFWDENKKFVSGTIAYDGIAFDVPSENCKYMKSSVFYKDIDIVMIVKGEKLPDTYMTYHLVELVDIQDNVKNINSKLAKVSIPMKYIECTVAGQTQMTHPSIVYFEDKWNGYNYWMAVTPYPDANDMFENPSILASNDLINWAEPTGISNPIVPAASDNSYYNSDCELVYNGDTSKLECWYRVADRRPYNETICRKTSSDGVTWNYAEELFQTGTLAHALSPCVSYKNSKYMIWVNNNDQKKIEYYESTDGTNWIKVRDIVIDGTGNGVNDIKHPWHMSIKPTNNGYEMYFTTGFLENGYKNNMLYYCKSSDNITYSVPKEVLSATPFSHEDELYRPSFCDTNIGGRNKKRIIVYGVISNAGEWYINIGYTHIGIPCKLVKMSV